jgi:transposase InsO family protein
MKFVFIAKHRNIWPVAWLCNAMGVSRSSFHAWLDRSPSARSRSDEALGQQVKASFLGSDRTYGARRVWRDLLAEGADCGLHRIERLMRQQALRARPRRRRLPKDEGDRQTHRRRRNRADNALGHLVLQIENVAETTIKPFCPKMCPSGGIDELSRSAAAWRCSRPCATPRRR